MESSGGVEAEAESGEATSVARPERSAKAHPGTARRVALQLDMPDPPVCFKDEVVASGIDIRSNHLDTVMPDEPAMLEHVR